ncbi:MAG: family 43 glycosylhydrolase [Acidimicrobiales bacterium]
MIGTKGGLRMCGPVVHVNRLGVAVRLSGALLIAMSAVLGTIAIAPRRAAATPVVVSITPTTSPAFANDAPDPAIVESGGVYYAFTTGTVMGNYLQALVDTSGDPRTGWRPYTGLPFGSSALPVPPRWEQLNTQTSPGVFKWDGQWLMYYDAAQSGHAGDTGFNCLSVASAPTLTPSNPVFTDTSTSPLLCQPGLGGAVDPSPFVDPVTGQAYLMWKSNDGGSSQPARIWSQQLSPDGRSLVGSPTEIFTNDTVAYPWEATVEDPAMVYTGGTYYLFFSGGIWDSSSYGEGYAVCSGPLGPCSQPQAGPFLSSTGNYAGPGGASVFADASGNWWIDFAAWKPSCTSYSCGGMRRLFVTEINLPVLQVPTTTSVSVSPPVGPQSGTMVYRATVSPTYGNATPGGSVIFGDAQEIFCSGTLLGGSATCIAPSPPPGTTNVIAAYGGDGQDASSWSATGVTVSTSSSHWLSTASGPVDCRQVGVVDNVQSHVECTSFDPAANTWTTSASPVTDWGYGNGTQQWLTVGNTVDYCRQVGVVDNVQSHVECTSFDPAANTWTTSASPVTDWGYVT